MSEVTNIKTVRFEDERSEGYGDPLYAYDWGQKLRFEGIDLPDYYEVVFSDHPDGTGTIKMGTPEGVDVPRACLMHPGMLYLWIYLHFDEDTDSTTVYRARLEILERADAEIEATEEEAALIAQVVAALNEASGNVAQAMELVDAMPRATYMECGSLSPSQHHYTIDGMTTDCRGLWLGHKPEGYEPRENDILFVKMTADLTVPTRSQTYIGIEMLFDTSWSETDDQGRTIIHDEEEEHRILNIGYAYPAGMLLFEKDRIYAFRTRYIQNEYHQQELVYEIIDFHPGMKEAVEAAAQSADEAEAALADVLAAIEAQPNVKYYEINTLQRTGNYKTVDGNQYAEFHLPVRAAYETPRVGDILMLRATTDILAPVNTTTQNRFYFDLLFNASNPVMGAIIWNTQTLQVTQGRMLFRAGRWYPVVYRIIEGVGNRFELLEFHPEEEEAAYKAKADAVAAATAAQGSADNAAGSASSAAASATSAQRSASAASAAAGNASGSASSAAQSASAANGYASAASQSATQANQKAGQAADSSAQARSSATQARNSANGASQSASAAYQYSLNAKASADEAWQNAKSAGYMQLYIDENGHLIFERTKNIDIDFELDEGRLIAVWP